MESRIFQLQDRYLGFYAPGRWFRQGQWIAMVGPQNDRTL